MRSADVEGRPVQALISALLSLGGLMVLVFLIQGSRSTLHGPGWDE